MVGKLKSIRKEKGNEMSFDIKSITTPQMRLKGIERANAIRKERKELKERIAKGEFTAEEILNNLDKYPCMQNERVKRFIRAFKGLSYATADKLMEQYSIADCKRLKGLGKRQREGLIKSIDELTWE